jgi:hypothetical protein
MLSLTRPPSVLGGFGSIRLAWATWWLRKSHTKMSPHALVTCLNAIFNDDNLEDKYQFFMI